MKIKSVLIIVILGLVAFQPDFLSQQKRYGRVRSAIQEKNALLESRLKSKGLQTNNFHVLFVAYKDQDELEIYVKNKTSFSYQLLHTYAICSRSGELGPKRKQGDYQVPEGFYHIDRFNPTSNFHFSLGLNYPNSSDKKKSKAANLGGDIFIHGACVTIGCLPLTDDKIKEVYLLAVHAKNNGQTSIPVYVFPYRMSDKNKVAYEQKYGNNKALIQFWKNLKTGYDLFQKTKKEIPVKVSSNGDYLY